MPEQKPKFPIDSFVSKIVKDPKNPPEVTMLKGYLGNSSLQGYIRLYFDADLQNYVDIPDKKIVYTQKCSKNDSSLSGNYVWIYQDADLIYKKSVAKNKFFEGQIIQDYMKNVTPNNAYGYQNVQSTGLVCFLLGTTQPTNPLCTSSAFCPTILGTCHTSLGC